MGQSTDESMGQIVAGVTDEVDARESRDTSGLADQSRNGLVTSNEFRGGEQ
jgi:hypothetical protein